MLAPRVCRYFGANPSHSLSPVPASTSATSSRPVLRFRARKPAMDRQPFTVGPCSQHAPGIRDTARHRRWSRAPTRQGRATGSNITLSHAIHFIVEVWQMTTHDTRHEAIALNGEAVNHHRHRHRHFGALCCRRNGGLQRRQARPASTPLDRHSNRQRGGQMERRKGSGCPGQALRAETIRPRPPIPCASKTTCVLRTAMSK